MLTVTEDTEATLEMVSKLGRSALEALAFESLINFEKHAAAIALADADVALKVLAERRMANRKGGQLLRAATVTRDLALEAYRKVVTT